MRIKTILITAVVAPVLAACGDQGPSDERLADLDANRGRWDSLGPASYVYEIERVCFCPVEYLGPVRVRVESGVPTERTYVETGLAVPAAVAVSFPGVDGLFEVLREAIEGGAHSITVAYDPTLGVPMDFYIDYEETMADEELGMRVTEAVAPIP